jgi:hypothetical protein
MYTKKMLALGTIILLLAVGFSMLMPVCAEENVELPVWAVYNSGSMGRYDYARDSVVDSQGNIYVVGYGYETSPLYNDAVIIKYDSNGNLLWKRTYDGTWGLNDMAYACTVDPSGNVYVLVRTDSLVSDYDILVIKYGSSGSQLWARTYNGPANFVDRVDYWGQPILYDEGLVFITGYSYSWSSMYDATTICYNALSGTLIWIQRYHGGAGSDFGRSLAIAGGYLYMTGYTLDSINSNDVLTICYNKYNGAQIWVSKYHGGMSLDYGFDVAADNYGRVFVTGVVAARSSLFGFEYDRVTIAYNGVSGALLWARTFNADNDDNYGYGIVTDDYGTVYSTGHSYWTSSNRYDIVTIAYDAATGSQKWMAQYDGPGTPYSYEFCYSKPVLDANGNLIIGGMGSNELGNNDDMIVLVYDPNGNNQMVGRFNGLRFGDEWCYSVNVDSDGNIYAVGYGSPEKGTMYYYDIITVKFVSSIPATVKIEPTSLNLNSMGNYVNVKVGGFPDNPEYTPLDVDGSEVTVAGMGTDLKFGTWNNNKYIGKADRLMFEDIIGEPGDDIEIEVTGKLVDGTRFEGVAIIEAHTNSELE